MNKDEQAFLEIREASRVQEDILGFVVNPHLREDRFVNS
jgi:hypothetical protein